MQTQLIDHMIAHHRHLMNTTTAGIDTDSLRGCVEYIPHNVVLGSQLAEEVPVTPFVWSRYDAPVGRWLNRTRRSLWS